MPEGDGYNASDMFLASLYQRTLDQGLAKTVFWSGEIASHAQFIELAKRQSVVMSFAFIGQDCAGYAWLCPITGNYAYPHFVFFRNSLGEDSKKLGKMFIDQWFGFTDSDGGRLLDLLFGVVPDFNKLAHKYVEKIGGTKLGKVPKLFKNKQGERRDALVFYWSPDED